MLCLKRAVKIPAFSPPQVLWFLLLLYHHLAFSGHRFPAACVSLGKRGRGGEAAAAPRVPRPGQPCRTRPRSNRPTLAAAVPQRAKAHTSSRRLLLHSPRSCPSRQSAQFKFQTPPPCSCSCTCTAAAAAPALRPHLRRPPCP